MNQNAELALRVSAIEERNKRVELEKAWEVSRTRKISIVVLTYLVTTLVFWSLQNERHALNAFFSHPRILSFYGIASKGQGMVAKFEGVLSVAR